MSRDGASGSTLMMEELGAQPKLSRWVVASEPLALQWISLRLDSSAKAGVPTGNSGFVAGQSCWRDAASPRCLNRPPFGSAGVPLLRPFPRPLFGELRVGRNHVF